MSRDRMNLFGFVPGYGTYIYDSGREPAFLVLLAFILALAGTRFYTRMARVRGWGSAIVGDVHVHHLVPGVVLSRLPGHRDPAERKAEAGPVRDHLLSPLPRRKPSPRQTDLGVGQARLPGERAGAPAKPGALRHSRDALGRAQAALLRSDRRRSSPGLEARQLKSPSKLVAPARPG